jgi:hypothetical protein
MDFIDIIIQSNQHQDCTFVVENWGILPNKLISGKNIDTQCTTTYTTFNFTYVILTYPGVLIEKYYIDTTTTFNFTCDSDISWSLEWEILLGSYTRFFFRFQICKIKRSSCIYIIFLNQDSRICQNHICKIKRSSCIYIIFLTQDSRICQNRM